MLLIPLVLLLISQPFNIPHAMNKKYIQLNLKIMLVILLFTIQGVAQRIQEVSNPVITVSNLEESVKFYSEVLTFQLTSTREYSGEIVNRLFGIDDDQARIKVARLQLGSESIQLLDFISPTDSRPIPLDSKSNDLWFQHIAIVTNDMDKAYAVLSDHQVVHVSTSPQTLPDYIPEASGIKAFYFRDPDGHNLEIIYFPEQKGNPKWQTSSGGPFLGIDHSAIGIDRTDRSLRFYQDILGLVVMGKSENFGPEQEHLNQVFGARLLITGLRAQQGIGFEFLDYIAPPGGRPYPRDSQPNDLWHWHTTMYVNSLEKYHHKLMDENIEIISNGIVVLDKLTWGYSKGLMIRDPDKHAVLLVEN